MSEPNQSGGDPKPVYPQYDGPDSSPESAHPAPPPQYGQPQYGQPQYGQVPPPNPAPQNPAPQIPAPPNYGQAGGYGHAPGYPQPPAWQPPPAYNGSPAYGPYAGGPIAPKHPSAVTALVLGIISVVGVVICIGTLLAPFAWYLGQKAVSEIDQNPGAYTGRGEANAGKILGIVGTVLLTLVVLYWVMVFGLIASGA